MDIKCIALDLDMTTLDRSGRLSEGNRQALEHAIARGVHIIIASGRSFDSLPADVLAVPGIEYAITSNGAAVYHIPTRRRLTGYTLEPHSVREIMARTVDLSLTYEAFLDGVAYADAGYVSDPVAHGAAPRAIRYIQTTRHPEADIRGFILAHCDQLDSLDLVTGDPELKARTEDLLRRTVPDIYVTSSVPQLIEISHRKAGKHSGVRFVAELLGLSPAQVAAFGDGDNDADMLTYVGCGIAVENATPACRAAARYITSHHHQDGVARGIYDILHI